MSSLIIAGDTSGTITLAAPAVAGTTTLTLPATTDTLVGKTTTDTLTNKTLTSPTITGASITVASTAAPAFSAYQSSAQTLPSATSTVLQYQTKEFDTGTCFNNTGSTVTLNGISTPAYAFAPNVAGYYQVNGAISNGTSTQTLVQIFKNGSGYKTGNNTNQYLGTVSSLVYLNGTSDYIQIYGYFGASTATGNTQTGTYFNASFVRSA